MSSEGEDNGGYSILKSILYLIRTDGKPTLTVWILNLQFPAGWEQARTIKFSQGVILQTP